MPPLYERHFSLANVKKPVCPLASAAGLAMTVVDVGISPSLLASPERCLLFPGRGPRKPPSLPWLQSIFPSRTSYVRRSTSNVLMSTERICQYSSVNLQCGSAINKLKICDKTKINEISVSQPKNLTTRSKNPEESSPVKFEVRVSDERCTCSMQGEKEHNTPSSFNIFPAEGMANQGCGRSRKTESASPENSSGNPSP